MKNIEILFNWKPSQLNAVSTQSERVFIQVPDRLSEDRIDLSVRWAGKSHGIQAAYQLKTQDWEWWDIGQEVPDGVPFMPMGLDRLYALASTVAKPKYTVGQVVELAPEDREEFHPGTRGLIVAVHAYNDNDETGPYTAYTVQIADDPPGEHNDGLDGYVYEGPETTSVYETQIVKVF